jgi:hypothetical protein
LEADGVHEFGLITVVLIDGRPRNADDGGNGANRKRSLSAFVEKFASSAKELYAKRIAFATSRPGARLRRDKWFSQRAATSPTHAHRFRTVTEAISRHAAGATLPTIERWHMS